MTTLFSLKRIRLEYPNTFPPYHPDASIHAMLLGKILLGFYISISISLHSISVWLTSLWS